MKTMSNNHMSVGDLSDEEVKNILNVQSQEKTLSDDPKKPKIILMGKPTSKIMSLIQSQVASGALRMDDIEFREDQEAKANEYLEQAKQQFSNEMVYELKDYFHDFLSFGKGTPFKRDKPKIGRNQPCPCGSLKKFKHCCLNKKQ